MRRLLALLALVAVAGCGRGATDRLASDGTDSPAPTPAATTIPTPRPSMSSATPAQTSAPVSPYRDRVTLTNSASGRTITVAVGTLIWVRLQPELGNYDPPTSTASSVVKRTASRGGYPGNEPVSAVFKATASGTADLSSTTDAQCLHSQPRCMIPQKQWLVHVVVR